MTDGCIFNETRLGERLKALRGEMSQQKFAAQFGVKQTTYCNWERGTKEPSLAMVCTIASHFGVTVDWLLGMTDANRVGVSVQNRDGAVAIDHSKAEVNTTHSSAEVSRLLGIIESQQRVIERLAGDRS